MKYDERLLKRNYEPEIINVYKDIQKTTDLKTYAVYLKGGQIVRLMAFGYRYEVQSFVSLGGKWREDKTIGRIAFYAQTKSKKGRTCDYHYFKFNDVSAIVRED
jgi:hypothetical protein